MAFLPSVFVLSLSILHYIFSRVSLILILCPFSSSLKSLAPYTLLAYTL
jgi:hypothetical protein